MTATDPRATAARTDPIDYSIRCSRLLGRGLRRAVVDELKIAGNLELLEQLERATDDDLVKVNTVHAKMPPPQRPDDSQLLSLAGVLAPHLRDRLVQLVAADGRAVTVDQLEHQLQRAEDLAAECRRQLAVRDGQCERLEEQIRAVHAAADVEHARGCNPEHQQGETVECCSCAAARIEQVLPPVPIGRRR